MDSEKEERREIAKDDEDFTMKSIKGVERWEVTDI